MRESVFVLHTGGTIGMVDSAEGAAPVAGALAPYLDWIVDNSAGELPPIEFLELDPPIDSANATPEDWCAIARLLHERRADHSGFVVLHGTDTMAYTSSALSFLLPSFGKPVVVTGRRSPSGAPAATGARTSSAPSRPRPDPTSTRCRCSSARSSSGATATKIDASGLDAFASPRLAPLADIGIDIVVNPSIQPAGDGEARLVPGPLGRSPPCDSFLGSPRPSSPTSADRPFRASSSRPTAPATGPPTTVTSSAIERAAADGIVVVVVTQCVRGSVQPGAYATGSALLDAGAVPGYDMTSEAALTKLAVLLGEGRPPPRSPR